MGVIVPRYTIDDLDRFPEDGNRYELLDGVLLVTPAPRAVHQIVASRLQVSLSVAVQARGLAHVVERPHRRAPSHAASARRARLPARFAPTVDWAKVTEHWLAVEVLSRSSRVYDREFKRDAYFALGVEQVWLVDIADRSVEVWRRRDARAVVRDVIAWQAPTTDVVVRIPLDELFAGVD